MGAFKNHISQFFSFANTPISLNYHFRVTPLVITLYHSHRVAFRHIFMRFLCVFYVFLVFFLHKSQIFGVISLIVQPPPPLPLYHSIITRGVNPPYQ